MTRRVLVTGAAGFIGFHVAARLLGDGWKVVGADNLSPYYDPALKRARLSRLLAHAAFAGFELDLADPTSVRALFAAHRFDAVVHLAAQPGVRLALTEPDPYIASNVAAFLQVLEGCRAHGVGHLVFASSSSVYGANARMPFSEHAGADHPVSLYAATKKANELMAHAYAHLFGLPATGLRFFTVYGPWGRPDMAVYTFTDRIARGLPISVAAGGAVLRDFTYIDDVVEGLVRILARPPSPDPAWNPLAPDPATGAAPYRIYNIGGDQPEKLDRVVGLIEAALGRAAIRQNVALPPGDVPETRADTSDLARATGFTPAIPLETGIARFVEWYREHHPPAA
jgi:UDP-glucuronate 4-epimerase